MQPSNLNKQAIQSTKKFIHEHSFSVSYPYQTQDLTMDRCAVFFITAQFHRKLPKNGKYYETYIFTLLPHTHIRVRVTMNGNDTPCYLKCIFWVSILSWLAIKSKYTKHSIPFGLSEIKLMLLSCTQKIISNSIIFIKILSFVIMRSEENLAHWWAAILILDLAEAWR